MGTRFEGDIPKGKYVLVDDVTSSGATLADLSSYIQEQGGDVIGSVLLTNAMRGDKLIADKSLTKLLETKYGNEIRELFGIEPSSLTREEAKYLQGFRTTDELRASANKASSSRAERIRIKALPKSEDAKFSKEELKDTININGIERSANNDIRFSKEAIPEETTYQKSQRTVQDKFNRFSVIRDWLKERGVKLTELSNVYDAEERYHAKVANQLEDFREKIRNPLVEKIAKAGFTLSDVQDFLLAQHASEANKQIQKVRNDSEALAYGITDEEASEYLSKAKPELAALANELRDVTEQAKQLRLDAGILNNDITDNWDNTYKHYVPVKGDESIQGTGKGLNVKHKDKRRLGHEKRNEAVIENILMDYERAVMEVEKNRVGKYLVMFAAEANNPDLITVGQPEKRNILKENNSYAIVDSDGVIHSVYVNKVDAQRNAPPGSSIQKISDPRVIAQASPMLAPNEVNVYMDGHAIRVQLNDDLLARAYANMGVESVGAIVEAGRVLNSYLSKVYTGYNPEFIVTNIIRDFTSGIVNLTGEEGTLMAVKAIGNYPKMGIGKINHLFHKF